MWPGLGEHSYKITTTSQQAQAFFDQGLRLVYGFNFGEALASFRAAQAFDPACAMCFWGEAFALGPTLNATMPAAKAIDRATMSEPLVTVSTIIRPSRRQPPR